MALAGEQVSARARDVRGQPLAVRGRDHPVLVSLPDGDSEGRRRDATEKPQSRANARSSSCQPAMPSLTAVRKALAMKPANSPVRAAWSAGDTRPPSASATSAPLTAPPRDRRRRQAPPGQQGGAGKRVRPSSARETAPGGSERWFEETAALQPGDTEGFRASCQRHGIDFFPDSP